MEENDANSSSFFAEICIKSKFVEKNLLNSKKIHYFKILILTGEKFVQTIQKTQNERALLI